MVGHTGIMPAAIKAIETVDTWVGKAVDAVLGAGGAVLLSADHGNAETMYDEAINEPMTAHTRNPVPCILIGDGLEGVRLRCGGILADIAPTLLELMDIEKPADMTGKSLIIRD
jgi:2,3-bisphosphoglycerate-independent phosphoglycerate mutase